MATDQHFEAIARLITEKPELAAALQTVSSIDEAVEIVAKAGKENGVAVDKAALAAHLAEHSAAAGAKLSDADLDQVAGGVGRAILVSIISFGIACAGLSVDAAVRGYDCAKALD